ncbi:MAG: hypothetical protein WKF47_05470 [Geodermatophilaceae bacterium]
MRTRDGDAPEGGWPLVAFAHGTAGLGDQCAPSTNGIEKVLYLDPFIEAGYAVVALDFAGLGTDGIPGFLIGESEGQQRPGLWCEPPGESPGRTSAHKP